MDTSATAAATAAKNEERILQRLRELGIRIPEKNAWKETAGSMKDSPLFQEAVRLGAEWRAAVNRRSIDESIALGWLEHELGSPPAAAPDCSTVFQTDDGIVSDREEDLPLLSELKQRGVRLVPKYAYLKNFGRAKDDPDYEAAARAGAEWRDSQNRDSLTSPDPEDALDS